jgi:hypothetical protein
MVFKSLSKWYKLKKIDQVPKNVRFTLEQEWQGVKALQLPGKNSDYEYSVITQTILPKTEEV